MVHTSRPRVLGTALGLGLALGAAGCSVVGTGSDDPSAEGSVTLVTHDSFGVSDDVLAQFTAQTGLTVEVVALGDTGSMVNRLVLTEGAPLGDAVFGIDSTFATRALDEGIIAPTDGLTAPALADAEAHALPDDVTSASGAAGAPRLVAVDYGDVCVNVDTTWFAAHDLTPPVTLDDLTRPEYRGLFVTPNPATSSPGFAFLLATVGAKGDGWQQYWQDLDANGVQVAADWSDAYTSAFTAGGGNGDRPLVVSYDSSPPYTIPEGGTEPTTAALLDTCFRQTEYAGVLTGAKNPDGAAALVDFLLSDAVQETIPETMYMYPVSRSVALPPDWVAWAPLATDPFTVDPADIAAHREQWLTQWTDLDVG